MSEQISGNKLGSYLKKINDTYSNKEKYHQIIMN